MNRTGAITQSVWTAALGSAKRMLQSMMSVSRGTAVVPNS
jgi:hypothetical protein